MQTANLENSRRLHEVSDWTTGFWFSSDYSEDEIELAATEGWHNTPKYDLSFLLDKLPRGLVKHIDKDIDVMILYFRPTNIDGKDWFASYDNTRTNEMVYTQNENTLVDAACLLCINLFETNILKKGVN